MVRAMTRLLIGTLVLTMLAAANVIADDFWLVARPAPQGGLLVTGHVGHAFPTAEGKTTPDRIDSWRVIGASGDVTPTDPFFQDGDALATRVATDGAVTYLGVMTIKAREIEMSGKEFTEYLREEGLDAVIAERARRGQADAPARERYARYAKIVLHAGGTETPHVTRSSGLAAEFVPAINPATLAPGDTLSVQMLVHGRPVAGALIAAVSRDARLDARSDDDGRVSFTIPARGAWLIKTVHMDRPATTTAPPVDWESYWVTLAFEN